MAVEKIKCQYCGKLIPKTGLKNHEKSCPQNPANIKDTEDIDVIDENSGNEDNDNEEEKDEELEENTETTETTEEESEGDLVTVHLSKDHESYVGDKWYRFKAHKPYEVPLNVKNILKRAGLLEAK